MPVIRKGGIGCQQIKTDEFAQGQAGSDTVPLHVGYIFHGSIMHTFRGNEKAGKNPGRFVLFEGWCRGSWSYCTSMRRGMLVSDFGKVSIKIPSSNLAPMPSGSMLLPRLKLRLKVTFPVRSRRLDSNPFGI